MKLFRTSSFLRSSVGVALLCTFTTLAAAGTGTVRYCQRATQPWDSATSSTDPAVQASMRQNIWRLNTYTPYFDNKLSWMPNALVYIDSYAIYTNSPVASAHPEWILKDQAGNSLYIPWGCSNGSCPQYAADIANPSSRPT